MVGHSPQGDRNIASVLAMAFSWIGLNQVQNISKLFHLWAKRLPYVTTSARRRRHHTDYLLESYLCAISSVLRKKLLLGVLRMVRFSSPLSGESTHQTCKQSSNSCNRYNRNCLRYFLEMTESHFVSGQFIGSSKQTRWGTPKPSRELITKFTAYTQRCSPHTLLDHSCSLNSEDFVTIIVQKEKDEEISSKRSKKQTNISYWLDGCRQSCGQCLYVQVEATDELYLKDPSYN